MQYKAITFCIDVLDLRKPMSDYSLISKKEKEIKEDKTRISFNEYELD